MSPAPQGNLEVERYIGSYLISQRVPPSVKSSSANKRFQNHHHVKPKSAEPEKGRNFPHKFCFPPRDHHGGPRYPQLPVPVDYGHGHYGKHPPPPGGSGWAGVPLISMTSGNHRRNKKVPFPNDPPQKYANKPPPNYGKDAEDRHHDSDRSPLTRLAIHTQGAPLIQAGRYNSNRCRNTCPRPESRAYRGERWEPPRDAKAPVGIQHKEPPCANTDTSSVASDESCGNSENSLPRIIKPRKRRKKDRKPLPGPGSLVQGAEVPHPQYPREPGDDPASHAFLPSCFDDGATDTSETVSDLSSPDGRKTVDDNQSDDLIDPLASDEFPFGNLLDDEEDEGSESSSCAPATLCQCRYCDPSGVIWDVDQRCYSPFLTPPSPTALAPATYRPLDDLGLGSLLRRSWSDPSPYGRPDFPPATEQLDPRTSAPRGLQVSSEIVTSPNGHRDIEIKFYSSSVPLESKSTKSVSGRDNVDRRFVVEE